jgi:methoxymalonate biosynthesis acyl carrier protein
MEDVRVEIRQFLAGFVRQHDLRDDEDIFASGFVNSLFVMQLVLFVESGLGVAVEDEDLELANFRSVGAIAKFVCRKRSLLHVP